MANALRNRRDTAAKKGQSVFMSSVFSTWAMSLFNASSFAVRRLAHVRVFAGDRLAAEALSDSARLAGLWQKLTTVLEGVPTVPWLGVATPTSLSKRIAVLAKQAEVRGQPLLSVMPLDAPHRDESAFDKLLRWFPLAAGMGALIYGYSQAGEFLFWEMVFIFGVGWSIGKGIQIPFLYHFALGKTEKLSGVVTRQDTPASFGLALQTPTETRDTAYPTAVSALAWSFPVKALPKLDGETISLIGWKRPGFFQVKTVVVAKKRYSSSVVMMQWLLALVSFVIAFSAYRSVLPY